MKNTAYSTAYKAWFAGYERERRHQKKRKGSRLVGYPDPPANPEAIAAAVDTIGPRHVIETLGIHRSTLARWLSGDTVIPRPCWLLLILMSEGRLPGMSEDWRDFRFAGDALCQIGTRTSYTAREIAGWPYQIEHTRALERQIAALRKENAHLLKVGNFEAANDPIICAS